MNEETKNMADQEETKNIEDQEEVESPIVKIFKRVVSDSEFKQHLIENPDEALKEYNLSEVQTIMIKNLTEEDMNKLTPENLEEYFSADAAVYTPDEDEVLGEEAYSPEDFEDFDDDDE